MPRLACFACGRTVWATVPLAELFAEERRCPRCGASLQDDRRKYDRRMLVRRDSRTGRSPTGDERRIADRRIMSRRKPA
jgi:DNA-directed RNA polymerase subunit N (RpoN/RPB10)